MQAMYTDRYLPGLRWAYARVGEGAPRTAARKGRSRAHPQRCHNNCSAIKASTAQASTRSVRWPRCPSTRCTSTSLARTSWSPNAYADSIPTSCLGYSTAPTSHPGSDSSRLSTSTRLCARSSQRPSRSLTRTTRRASTPATTRRPLPHGSPIPPARLAPLTPNSSANNWRCCSMVPRPAPESSTPRPSPPPPPSQPSSSTTPSPPQRYESAQALSSSTAKMTIGNLDPGVVPPEACC